MRFSKIDYINLLPFHVFVKKSNLELLKLSHKKSKDYPSNINRLFLKKRIDGAFVSSIITKRCNCFDVGIVAKRDVLSVILIEGDEKSDIESNTSNMLAKVLNLKGEVLIGDKALKRYIQNSEDVVDLAKIWYEKYNLPFVFARFCFNSYKKPFKKISSNFVKSKVKIPYYILKEKSQKSGIKVEDIKYYLTKIEYKIDYKAKKSLKLFFDLSKKQSMM